jgi:RNA polymerase sigma factor (sigma-70 family)
VLEAFFCLSLSITQWVNTAYPTGSKRRSVRLLTNYSTRERAMNRKDGSTTSPALLKRVADWADYPAWCDFCAGYDHLIRSWCRGYGLDGSALEDLCQEIWIELADRMRTYQYDPGKSFRGWLRKLCNSRTLDLIRRRRTRCVRSLADQPADSLSLLLAVEATGSEEHDDHDSDCRIMLSQAEQVQHSVQQRVAPQTWEAFWRIAVEGCSVRESADDMGMSYAAAFAAHKRVGRMLRTEGKRHLAERSFAAPEAIASDLP